MSSSSSSYYDDECGATGYSSEVDSVPTKGLIDHSSTFSPVLGESVWHDHSYSSPALFNEASLTLPHKKEEPLSDDEGPQMEERELSRDELRARAMYIPFSVLQIVNMPVEEFMEVLDSHGFTPEQVTLLRDIRRRGKNKLAAQNCRKRKLDAIINLEQGVQDLRRDKSRLLKEKMEFIRSIRQMKQKMQSLYQEVFTQLRDEEGRPYPPSEYSLQYSADGSVLIMPRGVTTAEQNRKPEKKQKDKKK